MSTHGDGPPVSGAQGFDRVVPTWTGMVYVAFVVERTRVAWNSLERIVFAVEAARDSPPE